MDNCTHSFREMITLCFNPYKNFELKVKLLELAKKQRVHFLKGLLFEGIFFGFVFYLMYSVLNKPSEYIYFYMSKNIMCTLLVFVFKVVESL